MLNEREKAAAEHRQRMEALTRAVARSKALLARSQDQLARTRAITRPSTDAAFDSFKVLLDGAGIRSALAYLLSLSDYRFIGIFRFKGDHATSVVHVDREAPHVLQAAEVPAAATYCSYIRDGGEPFVTDDSRIDPYTQDHAAKNVVISYCGVPVVTPEGGFIGTLCHYDLEPRDSEQLDLELLVRVSSALTYSGLVPDYPTKRE